jgi:hypothetical protein
VIANHAIEYQQNQEKIHAAEAKIKKVREDLDNFVPDIAISAKSQVAIDTGILTLDLLWPLVTGNTVDGATSTRTPDETQAAALKW